MMCPVLFSVLLTWLSVTVFVPSVRCDYSSDAYILENIELKLTDSDTDTDTVTDTHEFPGFQSSTLSASTFSESNNSNTIIKQPIQISAASNHVRFYLFTTGNPDTGEELIIGSETGLKNSHYIKGAPLKVILHGFTKSATRGHGPRFKSAYLTRSRNRTLNVVLVDWKQLAMKPRYDRAAANSKTVGETTAKFISFLLKNGLVNYEDVHIIGHSLGAHAAGFAGRFIGAGKIGRITALDPAAPLFHTVDRDHKIDQSDAVFVDVIHTGAGFLSLKEPQGHVDFYPNGGKNQPGCGYDFAGICKHRRANYYMIESINNPYSFRSWICQSWDVFSRRKCYENEVAYMGEHVSKSARGTFYLRTNYKEPFSW